MAIADTDRTLPSNRMVFEVRRDMALVQRFQQNVEPFLEQYGLSDEEKDAWRNEDLRKLGVRLSEHKPGLYVCDAPEACAKLIASTCDAGVKIVNMTSVDDVIIKGGKVLGAVVNWSPVGALPRQLTCVDPVSFEAPALVDATGHDAAVCQRLVDRGLIEMVGMGAMDAGSSEDAVLAATREVYPGLFSCGISVCTVDGVPRMGPTFGAMLLSGRKTAELVLRAAVPEPELVAQTV